jgi:hypothetical protein
MQQRRKVQQRFRGWVALRQPGLVTHQTAVAVQQVAAAGVAAQAVQQQLAAGHLLVLLLEVLLVLVAAAIRLAGR